MKLNTEEMSNYEKWCEQWRLKFMNMDQNVLRTRLPELTEEGEQLTLYHFSRKFGINKTDGSITVLKLNGKRSYQLFSFIFVIHFLIFITEKPRKPFGSGASYAWTHRYHSIPELYIYLFVSVITQLSSIYANA